MTIADLTRTVGLAWHWLSANALLAVIVINFAVLACALGLAINAVAASRRMKRLVLAEERNARLVERLMKEVEVQAATIGSLSAAPALPSPPPVQTSNQEPVRERGLDHSIALHLREEIASLQHEISMPDEEPHYSPAPPDPRPVERNEDIETFARLARDELESLKSPPPSEKVSEQAPLPADDTADSESSTSRMSG